MKIMNAILNELKRARKKFPLWPTDPLHALAIVQEEVGEMQRAANQCVYEPERTEADEVRKEAIQAAAMLLRFLESFSQYEWTQSKQHRQKVPCAACDFGNWQLGHSEDCPKAE